MSSSCRSVGLDRLGEENESSRRNDQAASELVKSSTFALTDLPTFSMEANVGAMEEVSAARSVAKGSEYWAGLDTMCSDSLTAESWLTGPLFTDKLFKIRGWGPGCERVQSYGVNPYLGPLIYTKLATQTLLAYSQMTAFFRTKWNEAGTVVILISKIDPRLILEARLSNRLNSKLLLVDLSPLRELMSGVVEAKPSEVEEGAESSHLTMSTREYQMALEVWRLHRMHHVGAKIMKLGVQQCNLSNYPFTPYAVDLMSAVGGTCPVCLAATMTERSTRERAVDYVRPERPVVLTAEEKRMVYETDGEVLLFDLMYVDGKPYLVTSGLKRKLKTIVALPNKTAQSIMNALNLIILDYKRAKVRVEALTDLYTHLGELDGPLADREVSEIQSDNEPGLLANALKLMDLYGVDCKQVPAGEHVGGIERPIRTIVSRMLAMRISLPYQLPDKALPWLAAYCVHWMNIYPSTVSNLSAWNEHNSMRLLYSDVTRAGFGESVFAWRPVQNLPDGVPPGEEGICFGMNPRSPGAIWFYSLETGQVKSRTRFSTIPGRDLTGRFGVNRYYVAPSQLKRNRTTVNEVVPYSPDPLYSPDQYRRDREGRPMYEDTPEGAADPQHPGQNTPATPNTPTGVRELGTPGTPKSPRGVRFADEPEVPSVVEDTGRNLESAFEEVEDHVEPGSVVPEPPAAAAAP